MNIFVLDLDPVTAARMHCDKHVPKMCVEAAQMMASALRRITHARCGLATVKQTLFGWPSMLKNS
jgi:hypothetical protein